jgi:hypothetical protein
LVVRAVQGVDSLLGFAIVIHFHKPETARPTGFPIRDHLGSGHIAVLLEQRQEVVSCTFPREVADVNILRHLRTFLCPVRRSELTRRDAILPSQGWLRVEADLALTRVTFRGAHIAKNTKKILIRHSPSN